MGTSGVSVTPEEYERKNNRAWYDDPVEPVPVEKPKLSARNNWIGILWFPLLFVFGPFITSLIEYFIRTPSWISALGLLCIGLGSIVLAVWVIYSSRRMIRLRSAVDKKQLNAAILVPARMSRNYEEQPVPPGSWM